MNQVHTEGIVAVELTGLAAWQLLVTEFGLTPGEVIHTVRETPARVAPPQYVPDWGFEETERQKLERRMR